MKKNKPSSTAKFVVSGLYSAAEKLNKKGANAKAKDLVEVNKTIVQSIFPKLTNKSSENWFLKKMGIMDTFSVKGFHNHFLARKSQIIQILNDIDLDNIDQVIVIGAGFDACSFLFSDRYPSIQFIEIDHPATKNYKLDKLGDLYKDKKNIAFIPHDIEELTLAEVLKNTKEFDPAKKSVFIVEGLLMYLTENAIQELISTISSNSSTGSYFIFTFMNKRDGSFFFKNQHPFMNIWLSIKGEKFIWGKERNQVDEFLKKFSFELQEIFDHQTMLTHFESDKVILADGELVAFAKKV